jgi:hypothetical protein
MVREYLERWSGMSYGVVDARVAFTGARSTAAVIVAGSAAKADNRRVQYGDKVKA